MSEKIEHEENEDLFSVVTNYEGQYSIWPLGKEIPTGWKKEGNTGTKSQCLEYISKVWTDITPQSLRR